MKTNFMRGVVSLQFEPQPGFPTMSTAPNPMTSTLDALSRTSDQVYDDLLHPEKLSRSVSRLGSSRRPCWRRAQRS
jgi:hypothetical protein